MRLSMPKLKRFLLETGDTCCGIRGQKTKCIYLKERILVAACGCRKTKSIYLNERILVAAYGAKN